MQSPAPSALEPAGTFRVGTLSYNKQGLFLLFFWLMWNDWGIAFFDQASTLTGFIMRDLGASYTTMGTIATIASVIGLWLNPVLSVWSDRHRGRWGRRRPFLFAVVPVMAFFLAITPWMPDLHGYLMTVPWAAGILNRIPMNSPLLFVAAPGVAIHLLTLMIYTLFSFLYWDVVPESVLGRFSSMSRIAAALANFLWLYYLFGYSEHHLKAVFFGVALFCLVLYTVAVWQIKEGEYPPPDVHEKGGAFAPIRSYFVECYSKPFYLWVFGGIALIQIGKLGDEYRNYYLHYDLKLSLDEIGKASSAPLPFIMVLGLVVGSWADRLKPVRLMPLAFLAWAMTNVGAYWFVHDQWSFIVWFTAINAGFFVQGVLYVALIPEVYPREKLGQFCSAGGILITIILCGAHILVGMFFDYIHYTRFCFLWSATFQTLGALAFMKVYSNWRKLNGHVPVPHAG